MWCLGITGHVCREERRFKKTKKEEEKKKNFGEREINERFVGEERNVSSRKLKLFSLSMKASDS